MNIFVATSKTNDGNMLTPGDNTDRDVIANRASFLAKNGIDIKQTTRVNIVYEGDNYCRYFEVDNNNIGSGMEFGEVAAADALVTRTINHALFLPIADCVGTVIFDPNKQILMLSHLGRHSLEQNGGRESVKFLAEHYNCIPSELLVWLTPAPGPDVYPLHYFNGRSIKNVVFQQLQSAGILPDNITDDSDDTSKNQDYYSHSEFLKGNRPNDGRYAVVAVMQS
jgi:copper oxidase (laccase) domain-containing protein